MTQKTTEVWFPGDQSQLDSKAVREPRVLTYPVCVLCWTALSWEQHLD